LAPNPHAGARDRIGGTQAYVGKDVLEIFVDDRGFGDDRAVMHQHGHLAVRIDPYEGGLVLLEAPEIDVMADEIEALLLQADQRLHRIGDGFGMIELEHRAALSVLAGGVALVGAAEFLEGEAPGIDGFLGERDEDLVEDLAQLVLELGMREYVEV